MTKFNVDLKKLLAENHYDVDLKPQGEGPYGHGVGIKVETMDSTDTALRTKKKVSLFGFGKSLRAAERDALLKALELLDLN